MGTIADKLGKLLSTKAAIRQAVSAMGQTVEETLPFSGYAAKILAISSDATAAAGDILSGKTAYAGGEKVTGTIAGRGASDLTASGAAVSVPAGYYPENVSKSVAAAEQAVPEISVSSNGLITASAAQAAGYVAAGTKSASHQLTTQAAATITPGTAAKTAVAAGRFTTGAVTVAGDSNLAAGNIKSGVSIFGVAGSLASTEIVNLTIVPQGFKFSIFGYGPNGIIDSRNNTAQKSFSMYKYSPFVYTSNANGMSGVGPINLFVARDADSSGIFIHLIALDRSATLYLT